MSDINLAGSDIIVTEPSGKQLFSLREDYPTKVSDLVSHIQEKEHSPGTDLTEYRYKDFTYKLQDRNSDGETVLLSVSISN